MAKMNKNISKLVIEKPVVGGSVDVWGSIINKDLDNIGTFANEVATKMDTHDQELANLENDKVSKNEVETTITPIVNNYVENTVKPNIDTYINDVSKPAIDKYVDGKKPTIDKHITDELAKQIEANKSTLDTYVETDEKPKLDAYEKEKEQELDTYVTTTAQTAIDTYVTDTTKPSLDAYEKEKEQELDAFKETKTTEITAHTDTEKERITTEINNVAGTAKQSVTNEGTKQVGLVTVEGNKVIEQVKTLVEGNPATTNALTLSGKTRAEFEKEAQGVIGEYEGTFPLTSAVQNKVYYIPTIGKYYRCKTAYNGTQLTMPNENFEEISTSINSDKLGNLINITSFKNEEILFPDITISNACNLTIVGNIAHLFLDGVLLNNVKNGYNDLIKIPRQYTIVSVIDGTFINTNGASECYVRAFDNKVCLFSKKEILTPTRYSYLTMSIPVKKLY